LSIFYYKPKLLRIDILTCVPALLEGPLQHSILGRAQKKGLAELHVHNLHDYSPDKNGRVDDYPFGGGGGMVMTVGPLSTLIRKLQAERTYDEVIFMTPDAPVFSQTIANELSLKTNLMVVCGHYKGIDERIRERFITRDISVGDYVLTGGELPAAIVADAVVRLLPGVLTDEVSALTDSHMDGLLSAPVFTRPSEWEGMEVPQVLLSGHDAKIQAWRHEQQLARTASKRPDLLAKFNEGS
jgi:tRNA (guanine37-N1)-methyltransferase